MRENREMQLLLHMLPPQSMLFKICSSEYAPQSTLLRAKLLKEHSSEHAPQSRYAPQSMLVRVCYSKHDTQSRLLKNTA